MDRTFTRPEHLYVNFFHCRPGMLKLTYIVNTRLLQACDLYRHGTTNVTILSQPFYYLLTVPNPKLFQSNLKVVTRL